MIEITVSGHTLGAVVDQLRETLNQLEPDSPPVHTSEIACVDENAFGELAGIDVPDGGDVRDAQPMEIRRDEIARVGDVIRPSTSGIPVLRADFVVQRSDDYGVTVETAGGTRWSISHGGYTIVKRAEPSNIMARIEEAAHRYLGNENMIAPKVVILGVKEWDEVYKGAQEDCSDRPCPTFVTSQVRVEGLELRAVRDADRDSCLEVYG